MPQIRHIARFNRPESKPILQSTNEQKETTPVRSRHLPEKLREIVEKRSEEHETLVDLLSLMLEESTQPLTALEVGILIEQKLGKKVDVNLARIYLQQLEKLNRVSHRVETTEERTIRANGQKVRALHAQLWWAPPGEVPARTVTEAVPGVVLIDTSGRKRGVGNKKKPVVELVDVDPKVSVSANPVIDYLVNKLVQERTQSIADELQQTKEELDRLRGKLKSIVGDL